MIRPNVKICGITNVADALLAVNLGATQLGFIFANSPRQTSADCVASILEELARCHLRNCVEAIGVFVNAQEAIINTMVEKTGLDTIQIHGDETPADCLLFPFSWYRALRIASVNDVETLADAQLSKWQCPRLLFDAAVPGLYGGSGITVDAAGKEFFIAGGISPDNVAEILTTVQPDGIDVGSGVEESPGKKSVEKLTRLFMEIQSLYGDTTP